MANTATLTPSTLWTKPVKDDKLDFYHQQMGDMFEVFDKARGARGTLQEEYDRRNQEVLDKLESLREWTEEQAQQRLGAMRAFSEDFAEGVASGERRWRRRLAEDRTEALRLIEEPKNLIDELAAGIRQEHEDCVAHTTAETDAIQEQLRLHRETLTQQIADREHEHAEFVAGVQEHFGRLRQRLKEEAELRKKQCSETSSQVRVRFARFEERLQRFGATSEVGFAHLREKIAKEREERAQGQASVALQLRRFMEEFERNLAAAQAKQDALEAELLNMKVKVREDAA